MQKNTIRETFREIRTLVKIMAGIEPSVKVEYKVPLEFCGTKEYGGWAIPDGFLDNNSVIVDAGLGEDISFSEYLIEKYGCQVYGFDPTPKSITFIKNKEIAGFNLHEIGLASSTRSATFYLPNEKSYVSGSITKAAHVGAREIKVELVSLSDLFKLIKKNHIDILKIDIEGAEYELIKSEDFAEYSSSIKIICIEFHHRWAELGKVATEEALSILGNLGFKCIWKSSSSNEEFTFMRA